VSPDELTEVATAVTVGQRFMDRIRGLDPVERLLPEARDALLRGSATTLAFAPGELVYAQGAEDAFVNYLLRGRVERAVDGTFTSTLDAEKDRCIRPLDAQSPKRHTLRAASPVTILRVHRSALERAFQIAHPYECDGVLEVMEITSDGSNDWWTRLLSSELFTRLSAPTIHALFERLIEVHAQADDEIVRQGDRGDYYYIVQSGACNVVRRPSAGGHEVHLANLGPGDGFGEEALISGARRNATVRMITDGCVMRLGKADFRELLLRPLVRGVSYSQARWLVEQGACWVDGRKPEAFKTGALDGAINIPPHLIRLHSRRLDKARSYIVCGDERGANVLGAFMLSERGFDASYLEQPLGRILDDRQAGPDPPPRPAGECEARARTRAESGAMTEPNKSNGESEPGRLPAGDAARPVPEPAVPDAAECDQVARERVPRDRFDATSTGEDLADLIDELYERREELDHIGASPDESSAQGAGPAVADGSPWVEDLLTGIVHDIDANLRRYLTQSVEQHRVELSRKLEEHATRLEQQARAKIEARDRELRQHYETVYASKEQKLRADYDRLTTLANKVSRQKAEIQKARKNLESMLRTADRVHKEVFRVGSALAEQVDHLGELGDDIASH
jgi:CRP-like cAMP-binding protein